MVQLRRSFRVDLNMDEQYDYIVSQWKELAVRYKYGFAFSWLGQQICQEPEDIVAFQELVWTVKPDLIIETGIAEGGSLLLSATMLALLNAENPIHREVIGIDINIGLSTRLALSTHPLSKYITRIEGDSTNVYTLDKVKRKVKQHKKVLVCLDSDHSHNHVLKELENYAPFVSEGSYCIVFDTGIEDLPDEFFVNTTCRKGNSPRTAVNEYLKMHPEFEIDTEFENKLVFTCAKGGWLKRI
jgi:cephalosporin hydroxylase